MKVTDPLLPDTTSTLKVEMSSVFFSESESVKVHSDLVNQIKSLSVNNSTSQIEKIKYLISKYKNSKRLIVTQDQVIKLFPNLNINLQKAHLHLFGIKLVEGKDDSFFFYSLDPFKFLNSFLINLSQKELTFDEKVDLAFSLYDSKNNGYIEKSNINEMLMLFNEVNCLNFDKVTIGKISEALYLDLKSNDNENRESIEVVDKTGQGESENEKEKEKPF